MKPKEESVSIVINRGRPSQRKCREEDVSKVVHAFSSFHNSFAVDNNAGSYCLSSGIPADKAVRDDFLNTIHVSEYAWNNLIYTPLFEKTFTPL